MLLSQLDRRGIKSLLDISWFQVFSLTTNLKVAKGHHAWRGLRRRTALTRRARLLLAPGSRHCSRREHLSSTMRLSGPTLICLRKDGQGLREDLHIHGGQQEPIRPPTLRMHTSVHVHPFIPLSTYSFDSRSFQGPDTTQDRLESDAVLIGAPEFHAGFWICLADGLQFVGQLF
jgi:hypothetical protein